MTVSIGNMKPNWANANINFTALGMNVNSSAYGANSYVVNIKMNNTAIITVNTAGHLYSNVYMSRHYVSANIPAANIGAGARAFVVDSSSASFGATYSGGGSTKVPVWSDGANWKVG